LLPGAPVMHLSQHTFVSLPTISPIIIFCFSCCNHNEIHMRVLFYPVMIDKQHICIHTRTAQHTTKSFHMGGKLYIAWSSAAKAWKHSVQLVLKKLANAKRNWNEYEWKIPGMLKQRHNRWVQKD
jgi:hypothetical protein